MLLVAVTGSAQRRVEVVVARSAFNNHADIAGFLVAHHANVNAATDEGMRPLFVTAYKGYAEIVRLLLAGGAQSDTIDPGGGDALWAARMNGHHEIVNLLEANRAEPGRLLPDMH